MLIQPQSQFIREPNLLFPGLKPLGPIKVNRLHPLAKYLAVAALGNYLYLRDYPTHPRASLVIDPLSEITSTHLYKTGTSLSPIYTSDIPNILTSGLSKCSIVTKMKATTSANSDGGFLLSTDGIENNRFGIAMYQTDIFFIVAGSNVTSPLAQDKWHLAGMSFDDRLVVCRLNRGPHSSPTSTPSELDTSYDRLNLSAFSFGNTHFAQNSFMDFGLILAGIALTANQLDELAINPYQLFIPT